MSGIAAVCWMFSSHLLSAESGLLDVLLPPPLSAESGLLDVLLPPPLSRQRFVGCSPPTSSLSRERFVGCSPPSSSQQTEVCWMFSSHLLSADSGLLDVLLSTAVTRESSFLPSTEPAHLISLSSLHESFRSFLQTLNDRSLLRKYSLLWASRDRWSVLSQLSLLSSHSPRFL